ncbi:hypothetical protein [Simplicispira piscis]|jgi:hypothetical protein
MIKPWFLVPVLAVSALVGSAYWWHTEKNTWIPPTARRPELPRLETMPQMPVIRAVHAVQRPVFWTSRRPVDTAVPKKDLGNELTQSRLTLVLESGSTRVAILRRQDGSILKITTDTQPWRIESFDGRNAVFVSADAQRIERPLEAGSPAQVKAPIQGMGRPPLANQ